MPIEITDELRRAVHDEDCAEHGHVIDFNGAFQRLSTDPHGGLSLEGPDEATLAHLHCSRCSKVWLIVEDPGNDYADAVGRLRGKFRNPDDLRPVRGGPTRIQSAWVGGREPSAAPPQA